MKLCILFFALLTSLSVFSQSADEASVLRLSEKVFQWEVANRVDSVAGTLDARLIVVGSDGNTRNKEQYVQRLSDGSIVHNSIEIEESKATVIGYTAVVAGKGKFAVTSGGNKAVLHLSYMEVFVKSDGASVWKLLAIKASPLPQ
jgi:hypothetical protein